MAAGLPKVSPSVSFFENLESRVMLSGSVSATVVNGNLTIRGDSAANVIILDRAGLAAGQIRITGPDLTSINRENGAVILSGITGTVVLSMGQGNDTVSLTGLDLPGTVLVDGGAGNDQINVDDSTFRGVTRIYGGPGNDTVEVEANGATGGPITTFARPTQFLMGNGDDILQVGIGTQVGNRASFGSNTQFGGGAGNDTLISTDRNSFNGQFWIGNFETRLSSVDSLAPQILANTPLANAIAVPRNTLVTATFNEALDPSTVNFGTFTLAGPGAAPVVGTVSYSGNVATFTPSNALAANTLYTATVTTGMTDLAGNALQSGRVWTFTTGVLPDSAAPTVISSNPANFASNVAGNSAISATFSEAMNAGTINAATVMVNAPGNVPVAGVVSYSGVAMTFTPATTLAPNTTFVVTITTGVRDVAGNAMDSNYVWTFTTGNAPDSTAPQVTLTAPLNNATGVPLNQAIAATFTEAMNPATINSLSFTITGPGVTPVSGTVAYVGNTATFTPTLALAPNTLFTATITTSAQDLAGNPLASNHVWTFTTGATPDDTAPAVTTTDPINSATGVPANQAVAATFSEAMDPITINNVNYTLTGPGSTAVLGTVAYAGNIATFTPTLTLAPNTLYTATITTSAQDLAGNPLAGNYVWSFTTGATPDTARPVVTLTDPLAFATGVPVSQIVSATFSEAMAPLTINAVNFTLTGPGSTVVLGTVGYSGNTATFTPTLSLAPNTTFVATVKTGAQDLAGNALASDYIWTFTTAATPDTTRPSVTLTDPMNLAINVSGNQIITANFSEAMNAATISSLTFTVTTPGPVTVLGTVSYLGTTATFTPTLPLATNTVYTATITTGAQDVAGNALLADYVWTFTTGSAPSVLITDPSNAQLNVLINNNITGTFSEAMDPMSITGANFTLTGPGLTPVLGALSYDSPTNTFTFDPTSDLAVNTTFTATVKGGLTGVKDADGNAMVSDKVWTFTTGAQAAQPIIVLGRAGAYAVMATSSIASTGATHIDGNVGLAPGSSQGIPPLQVNGEIHVNDQAVADAQSDLLAAYNDAVSRSFTSVSLPGNMGGLTFTPGLYTNSTSVLISGAGPANNVTLDAMGDPNAVFIFQMGSTLTTGPGAQVILAGGAKASNIFWQVGTSATLDTTTIFKGNILASVTITLNDGTVVEGRLLGGANSNGSVTINNSTVSLPIA